MKSIEGWVVPTKVWDNVSTIDKEILLIGLEETRKRLDISMENAVKIKEGSQRNLRLMITIFTALFGYFLTSKAGQVDSIAWIENAALYSSISCFGAIAFYFRTLNVKKLITPGVDPNVFFDGILSPRLDSSELTKHVILDLCESYKLGIDENKKLKKVRLQYIRIARMFVVLIPMGLFVALIQFIVMGR